MERIIFLDRDGTLNEEVHYLHRKEDLKLLPGVPQAIRMLREKGYNPVNQIVGYIMSGDPTYITSHRNARSLIMKVERDELVEEILRRYIQSNSWG